jgi:hypothetical protein
MKDLTKLENRVEKYFKVINLLPYGDIDVRIKDQMGICLIAIYVKTYEDYCEYYKSDNKNPMKLSDIKDDMENMFPYVFKVFCKLNKDRVKEYGVN